VIARVAPTESRMGSAEMTKLNDSHDPARRSWIAAANQPDCDFPIQNLPFGIFQFAGRSPTGGVAIGDQIFDLSAGLQAGLFSGAALDAARAASGPALNSLMALGPDSAAALRARLSDLLHTDGPERSRAEALADRLLVPMASARMHLPVDVRNFTDFVCSTFHALRISRRAPDADLPPVLQHMPVAYHGRASSVQVSGEGVHRPHGQSKPADQPVQFGPCKMLDFELEVGAFIAGGNELGSSIPIESAASQIFGYCLLNDWSARDIQFWESMLGPFLGKSFATTISPWVVTTEALQPFRTSVFKPRPDWPEPLAYLRSEQDQHEGGIDIDLEAYIWTQRMRDSRLQAARITNTNLRFAYWTFAQMIAHHASNGCNLQPGDILGGGTISGPSDESRACLAEYAEPLNLPSGEVRRYLEDGDEIVFKGRAKREGCVSIGFGECRARIDSAREYSDES
jgi:fumarylacetoacetase